MVKNACFISYPHPKESRSFENLVVDFVSSLQDYLTYHMTEEVYFDDLRLKPGYAWNESITQNLCESACMIVIYIPLYEQREYCLREFLAMEKIEEERNRILGISIKKDPTRMIIPIVFKEFDEENLPKKIRDIQWVDFSAAILRGFNPYDDDDSREKLRKIAEQIYHNYKKSKKVYDTNLHDECKEFVIPSYDDAIVAWGNERTQLEEDFPL